MSVRYQLVMRSGPNPGASYSLDASQTSIGRDGSNTISINDAEVSRHHARMTLQGGKVVLEDLGSTNGTSVNGNRISGPHVLKAGEMVSLGEDIIFVFEAESFDPDATVVSSAQPVAPYQQPQPAAAPLQQPVPPQAQQAPPEAYVGQVPADPVVPTTMPPSDTKPGRKMLPIVMGVGTLISLCACVGILWFIDANRLWCTFFPFLFGSACG